MTISTRTRILTDNLALGDLYEFVDLARAANLDPATVVEPVYLSDDDPSAGPEGFEVELPDLSLHALPVTLTGANARDLAAVLQDVLDQDGDARAHLDEIRNWVALLR